MNHILTKKDASARYLRGDFGNRMPTYASLEDVTTWPIGLMYRGPRPGRRFMHYAEPIFHRLGAETLWRIWLTEFHADPEKICISGSTADHKLLIQGEVMESETGLWLRWSDVNLTMPLALAEASYYAIGLSARVLLQHYMDCASYENLQRLLEEYSGAVVEFSVFERCLGTLEHNTVFWEVRHY